jgi:hypothetical protein
MSAKLSHRQADQLPAPVQERILRRTSGAAGVHADQNRRKGAKSARGGRQGERVALRNAVRV